MYISEQKLLQHPMSRHCFQDECAEAQKSVKVRLDIVRMLSFLNAFTAHTKSIQKSLGMSPAELKRVSFSYFELYRSPTRLAEWRRLLDYLNVATNNFGDQDI